MSLNPVKLMPLDMEPAAAVAAAAAAAAGPCCSAALVPGNPKPSEILNVDAVLASSAQRDADDAWACDADIANDDDDDEEEEDEDEEEEEEEDDDDKASGASQSEGKGALETGHCCASVALESNEGVAWCAGETDAVGGGGGAAAAAASPSGHSDEGNEGNSEDAIGVAPQSETLAASNDESASNAAAEAGADANDAGGLLKAESNAEVAALSPQSEFVDAGACHDMSDDDAAVDDDGDDGGDDDVTTTWVCPHEDAGTAEESEVEAQSEAECKTAMGGRGA
jgi:hypothetical protein